MPAMKIRATFEMRDGDREWVGGVSELTVGTIAQAQQWVHREVAARSRERAEVDVVTLEEIGRHADTEGIPTDARLLGAYSPMMGEWEWQPGV